MMEEIGSCETLVLTTATHHNIPEDGILHTTFWLRDNGTISFIGLWKYFLFVKRCSDCGNSSHQYKPLPLVRNKNGAITDTSQICHGYDDAIRFNHADLIVLCFFHKEQIFLFLCIVQTYLLSPLCSLNVPPHASNNCIHKHERESHVSRSCHR
jgi:hypothetical protein